MNPLETTEPTSMPPITFDGIITFFSSPKKLGVMWLENDSTDIPEILKRVKGWLDQPETEVETQLNNAVKQFKDHGYTDPRLIGDFNIENTKTKIERLLEQLALHGDNSLTDTDLSGIEVFIFAAFAYPPQTPQPQPET